MPELLFELGCEEIPAEDLQNLVPQLKQVGTESFASKRIPCSKVETYGSPRRLVMVAELSPQQQELREQKLGPPKKIAIDVAGKPTPAGEGFAKNAGVPFRDLKVVETPKGEYLSAEVVVEGKPTPEILREIFPEIIPRLSFKKYMKWGSENFLFGRPIRNLVLLFDGEVVPLTIAGVSSGRTTFGHRFMGKKRLEVDSFNDYRQKLQANGIILSFDDRAAKITTELVEQSKRVNGSLRQDPELLTIMANEVEFPEVLTGSFPAEFLSLPSEVLINAMRKHQKYFCALDQNGQLLPYFFTVLNTHAVKADRIRQGHERVLLARLRDAEFFWREDLKLRLSARREQLARLTYHEKLGAYSLKIERMLSIAKEMLIQLKMTELQSTLEKLIQDSKTDLFTHMVGEFPELQGIMAGLYAREDGYPEEEWKALYDQYLPISAEDPVPRNLPGAFLSLADRFEVLSSGYVLNMIPTGSRDPYGLRRIATGAVKIMLEYQLDLDLLPILDKMIALYSIKKKTGRPELIHAILQLLEARFRFLMEQKGISYDYLNAVLAVERSSFVTAYEKLNSLWSKKDSNDLKTLARCFKRIQNIITGHQDYEFDPEQLQEDGEKRLHQVFTDIEFRVQQLIHERQYLDALDIMVTLGPEIDNFFDEVLVMSENVRLKENRISLLQRISILYRRIADFSALQIEGS